MSRKNQLSDLLQDQQSYETKRREIEAWLGRMEAWQARMRPVGNTQDVLEAQVREQKVNIQTSVIHPQSREWQFKWSSRIATSIFYNLESLGGRGLPQYVDLTW